MVGKAESSAASASARTDSNMPDFPSIPASSRTTSTRPPASPRRVTRGSLRRMQEAGLSSLSTQDVVEVDGPGHQVTDDLFGIGKGFHEPATSQSTANPALGMTQDTMQSGDESLQDVLKRMHSENMAARKKRRLLQSDASAAPTPAASAVNAATTKQSSSSKSQDTKLARRPRRDGRK